MICIRSAHFNAPSPIIHYVLAHYNALINGLIMVRTHRPVFADGAWKACRLKFEYPFPREGACITGYLGFGFVAKNLLGLVLD